MGKNVKKIQDMLTGNYEGKVQVGYGLFGNKNIVLSVINGLIQMVSSGNKKMDFIQK